MGNLGRSRRRTVQQTDMQQTQGVGTPEMRPEQIQSLRNYQNWLDEIQRQATGVYDFMRQTTPEERFEPLNADQLRALDLIRSNVGSENPLIEAASAALKRALGGAGFDEDYRTFYDPFVENVVGAAQEDRREAMEAQLLEIGGKAGMSGAFGGARQGLVEASALRDAARDMTDIGYRGRSDAHRMAVESALRNRQIVGDLATRGFQGAAQAQDLRFSDATALRQAGDILQQQAQLKRDFRFVNPLESLQQYANFAYTRPTGMFPTYGTQQGTVTTTETARQSPIATIGGLAAIAAAPFTGGKSLFALMGLGSGADTPKFGS